MVVSGVILDHRQALPTELIMGSTRRGQGTTASQICPPLTVTHVILSPYTGAPSGLSPPTIKFQFQNFGSVPSETTIVYRNMESGSLPVRVSPAIVLAPAASKTPAPSQGTSIREGLASLSGRRYYRCLYRNVEQGHTCTMNRDVDSN